MRGPGFVRPTLLLLSALALTAACGNSRQDAADTIFYNAHVYTMDETLPLAAAVAVTGDAIVAVGSNEEVLALAGDSTERIDLEGRMLLPGFIDAHMHLIEGGGYVKALALDTSGTVDGWIEAIDDYAESNPEAEVLFGYGFLASAFGPQGPLRQQIDTVVPDRPVLIMDEGFHAAWANSAALAALNITQDTPDPVPNFSYYKRDTEGNATGYLLEGTAQLAMDELDVITEDIVVAGAAAVIDQMNRYGITSAFDAGFFGDAQQVPAVLRSIEASGDLSIRLVGSYLAGDPNEAAAAQSVDAWRHDVKGERYHYRVLKILDDGTVEGRTAAMFEDYQGEPGNSGETVFSQQQLTQLVVDAAAMQIDLHIHALGERAVHEALNAIETARRAHANSSSRYTICHIQVITDEDLPRFAELDVIAQSTPLWASFDSYGEQFVSADQFSRFWRFNSLHELGVRLTFGSDYPASGAGLLGISPLFNIEIGHTRQEPGDRRAPVQPRESERLDIHTLLRGYTIDAAYQLHMENEIGSLVAGKKADLVVLEQNLFEVDAYDIHEVEVGMTVMDGEIVYEKL